jgi:hypothetical protein
MPLFPWFGSESSIFAVLRAVEHSMLHAVAFGQESVLCAMPGTGHPVVGVWFDS